MQATASARWLEPKERSCPTRPRSSSSAPTTPAAPSPPAVPLDHYGAGRVTVRSAGSRPGDDINPAVAEILSERGLDVSKEFPKPLTDDVARSADVIITMGCGDACPVYPGKRYLDWDLTDPAGKLIDEVRPIVDDIDQRAQALLAELLGDRTAQAPQPG